MRVAQASHMRAVPKALEQLVPAIGQETAFEADALRDAEFPHYYRISESNSDEENINPIAAFLDIPEGTAGEIARTKHLFAE